MGNRFSSKNGQSSERSVFPLGLNSRHVPKHLKPLRRPRKSKKSDSTSPPPTTNTTANPIEKPPQDVRLSGLFDKNIDWERPNHDSNSNENGPTGEQSSSRYRWLGGRRFHGDKVSQLYPGQILTKILKGFAYPLPIDQYELDRLRVQYYIFRWVFEG
ncbi:hypothetical protein CLU79DRAFT_769645 [Phycomyces nitens]|nr:hypothetical protein CLU79DRAFT_769645 [Phycomyces nitens]